MNNTSHAAPPMEKKKREQNADLSLLIFFLYLLSNTVSFNTGVIGITDILEISHSRGVEKRTERLSEIYFFLSHTYALSELFFEYVLTIFF